VSGEKDAKKQELERKLAELREAYATKLPDKFADLERLAAEARATRTEESAEALMRFAHTLAGTSGSYGFDAVSRAAKEVECLVGGPSAQRDDGAWESIDQAVSAVLYALPGASEIQEPEETSARPSVVFAGRLLVLDRDREFLSYVTMLAQQAIVHVSTFEDVEAAVAACEAGGFDAALISASDGAAAAFDAARRLRAVENHATLPVAFVAEELDEVADSCRGELICLQKPLAFNAFSSAIQRLLRTGNKERPRVLIVDDDPDFVDLASSVLSGEGMAVISITDPSTVMERMEAFEPDLVLLDVMMPKIDGFEICGMLRRSPRWQDTPVVFVTARTDPASVVSQK